MTNAAQFQTMAAAIGADISMDGAARLLAYLDAMLEENLHVNLTAVRDRESAVLFHALDSVALACCGLERAPKKALDIGTGNGFPGIAIACLYPGVHVLLMDRTLKKLKAITRALESAGFEASQFETVQMDAAEAPAHGYNGQFDLVTTRAVGPPVAMGRLASPLVASRGHLVTWLSDETKSPQTFKGGLHRVGEVTYTLPEPAGRVRRLAQYGF
jgi:16S rRNA (guanine527-N7)-methyltransferase